MQLPEIKLRELDLISTQETEKHASTPHGHGGHDGFRRAPLVTILVIFGSVVWIRIVIVMLGESSETQLAWGGRASVVAALLVTEVRSSVSHEPGSQGKVTPQPVLTGT